MSYYVWNCSKSLWGGVVGAVGFEPILVFSFFQAEQFWYRDFYAKVYDMILFYSIRLCTKLLLVVTSWSRSRRLGLAKMVFGPVLSTHYKQIGYPKYWFWEDIRGTKTNLSIVIKVLYYKSDGYSLRFGLVTKMTGGKTFFTNGQP